LHLLFRKKGTAYLRCRDCALVVVDPLPHPAQLEAHYTRDYAEAAGMGTARVRAEQVMRESAQSRLRSVSRLAPGRRWLEVGAGSGAFLAEASAAGIDIEGLDLSRSAVALLRQRGLRAHATSVQAFEAEPYDAVVGFDVIEHALDPLGFVRAAHRLLRPGGILALTTPDTRSLAARLMGSRWYHYIPETHLFLFDRHNLGAMLFRGGFRVVRHERSYKSLSLAYSMVQFKAYNPLVHALLTPASVLLPRRLRERPLPLPIGEFLIAAERLPEPDTAETPRDWAGVPLQLALLALAEAAWAAGLPDAAMAASGLL
jgi:SAM-dependent methyltransferase